MSASSETSAKDTVAVGCLFFAVSFPIVIVLRGYVLSVLWGWFIVGHFALPTISIAEALGLSTLTNIFLYTGNPSSDPKTEGGVLWKLMLGLLKPVLALLFTLGLGYVIHCFAR